MNRIKTSKAELIAEIISLKQRVNKNEILFMFIFDKERENTEWRNLWYFITTTIMDLLHDGDYAKIRIIGQNGHIKYEKDYEIIENKKRNKPKGWLIKIWKQIQGLRRNFSI